MTGNVQKTDFENVHPMLCNLRLFCSKIDVISWNCHFLTMRTVYVKAPQKPSKKDSRVISPPELSSAKEDSLLYHLVVLRRESKARFSIDPLSTRWTMKKGVNPMVQVKVLKNCNQLEFGCPRTRLWRCDSSISTWEPLQCTLSSLQGGSSDPG